jgi:hypothetical protein
MNVRRPRNGKTVLHNDGTVTHWCVYRQLWVREARLGDEVLAAMSEPERKRVMRHVESAGGCDQ